MCARDYKREPVDTLFRYARQDRRVVCLVMAFIAWSGPELWAAAVSTHTFGRYEIVIQEGAPFAMSEMLGTVRRQTGLPEYPLMLGAQKGLLALNILGPGNRPIQLAVAQARSPTGAPAATVPFVVEHSVREGETLTLRLRRAAPPRRVSFSVDLGRLERMLEGER